MKKKVYEKPMLTTEEFIAQQYVAICEPGKWEVDEGAPVLPNFHGYPDLNDNGVLDDYERNYTWTSDNSWKGPELPDNDPIYAWDINTLQRFVIWPTKNAHGVGYGESWIDKNAS